MREPKCLGYKLSEHFLENECNKLVYNEIMRRSLEQGGQANYFTERRMFLAVAVLHKHVLVGAIALFLKYPAVEGGLGQLSIQQIGDEAFHFGARFLALPPI